MAIRKIKPTGAKVIGNMTDDGRFTPAPGHEGTTLHLVRPVEIIEEPDDEPEDDAPVGSILHELRSRARRLERDAAQAERDEQAASEAVTQAQDRFARSESPDNLSKLRDANDQHLRATARAKGLRRELARLRAMLDEKAEQIACDDQDLKAAWQASTQPEIVHREQLDRVHALGMQLGAIVGELYRHATDASMLVSAARFAVESHGLDVRTFAPEMPNLTAYQVLLSRAFAQGLLDSGVEDARPLVTRDWLLRHLPESGEKTWADQGAQARLPAAEPDDE